MDRSANFPIIAITLRNNLKTLFARPGRVYPRWVDRVCGLWVDEFVL
jgi:hypothetical protein